MNTSVDLYSIALDAGPGVVDRLGALLCDDERGRAARFVTDTLRTRFVVARAALRSILGAQLACDPRALRFSYGRAGKPLLEGGGIDFNLSHSRGLAVVACARGCEIGIDVEALRTMEDLLNIARRFFAPGEYAQLAALEPSLQADAFFRCWTRKEAYLKARGDGITVALDHFEVSLLPDAPPALLRIDGDAGAAAQWQLHHLAPAPGYVGALAARAALEVQPWRRLVAEELG